jgi:hypothetical protein
MASTASPYPTISWFVEILTNNPPPEYAHLTSVIFKSDGGEFLGVLSIAFGRPCPKVDSDANGVRDAAMAAFVRKDLLEFDIMFVSFKFQIDNECSVLTDYIKFLVKNA